VLEMKKQFGSGAITLVFFLAGIGSAAAASGTAMAPKNRLSLTAVEQRFILHDVRKQRMSEEKAPSGFKATVGEAVPTALALRSLPSRATSEVPAVKSYDYAMLRKQLLIINPKDRKIADIIAR
jgi:Protein of unknown function (DUF1236)